MLVGMGFCIRMLVPGTWFALFLFKMTLLAGHFADFISAEPFIRVGAKFELFKVHYAHT